MAVADASTIILLAKTKILQKFAANHNLKIPEKVYREAVERGIDKGKADAYRIQKLIHEEDLITVQKTGEEEIQRIKDLFGITGGEAAAIAQAREHDELVMVDDQKGIKACKALEQPYTTALDTVTRLNELEELSQEEALKSLDRLEEFGWYKHHLVENRRNKIQKEVNNS